MRLSRSILGIIGLGFSTAGYAAETITYSYDANGRVVAVVHSGTVNNGVNTTYGHDAADNRTNVTTTGAP